MSSIHPSVILLVGALLALLPRGQVRHTLVLLAPALALGVALGLNEQQAIVNLGGLFELRVLEVTIWNRPFAVIFSLVALLGLLFARPLDRRGEDCAALVYAAAAVGAVLAGDLFTFYCWWEILALAATFLVFGGGTPESRRAAFRYLIFHIAGGLILMMGILWRLAVGYDAAIGPIGLDSPGGWLIFLGIGINCAWPLVHTWLTDAYPASSASGVLFLAAFTTKTAVYALLVMFPGTSVLVGIGVVMAIFPILFAIIEDDLRKVLAYSVINQVGFMVVGVGIGTELALNGVVAHALTDIVFKGLLFMTLGVCLYRTGCTRATELGGLFKQMPWTGVCCLIGAASLSAIPGFSGFVSKSMISSSVRYEGELYAWAVLGLLVASAGVLPKAGVKVPLYAFFAREPRIKTTDAPAAMKAAMATCAAVCLLVGLFPQQILYPLLPTEVSYNAYSLANVVSHSQLLVFSALACVLMILAGVYPREIRAKNLDFEVVWGGLCRGLGRLFDQAFNGIHTLGYNIFLVWLPDKAAYFFAHAPARISVWFVTRRLVMHGKSHEEIEESKAGLYLSYRKNTLPVGTSTLYAIVLLAILAVLALR